MTVTGAMMVAPAVVEAVVYGATVSTWIGSVTVSETWS